MATEALIQEKLKKIAESGKAANAYLLSGGTYEARLRLAKRFAEALSCSPADILTLEHENPGLISVNDVRRGVQESVHIKPYADGKKVYIIPDAEKMNVQAENALLKTLEEPPTYVVLLLLSENPDAFLETVLSRVVKFSLSEESGDFSGNEDVFALLEKGRSMRSDDILSFAAMRQKEKETLTGFTDLLRVWFRDVLIYKTEKSTADLFFQDRAKSIREYAELLSLKSIDRIFADIDELERQITANVGFAPAVFVLFNSIRGEMEVK